MIESDFTDWLNGQGTFNDRRWLFGDESTFAKLMSARLDGGGAEFDQLLNRLLENDARLIGQLETRFRCSRDELASRCESLRALLQWRDALKDILRSRDDSQIANDLQTQALQASRRHLRRAVCLLDGKRSAAAPDNRVRTDIRAPEPSEATDKNILDWMFASIGEDVRESKHSATVRDLARRLLRCESMPFKSATTAILMCEETETDEVYGRVMWLTVELVFGDGQGFVPDICALGLTSISQTSSQEKSFLDAMEHAWRMSGVEKLGYRGRWRLQNRCPLDCEAGIKTIDTANLVAPPLIAGSSGEAAALAAILAASGVIPLPQGNHHLGAMDSPIHPDGFPPLALNPAFVVSASLASSDGSLPTDCRLVKVDDVDKKAAAARAYGADSNPSSCLFDTLIISEQDFNTPTPKVQQLITAVRQKNYLGIQVARAQTMGQALHCMLDTNPWLQHLRKYRAQNWEGGWAENTGSLAAMMDQKAEKAD